MLVGETNTKWIASASVQDIMSYELKDFDKRLQTLFDNSRKYYIIINNFYRKDYQLFCREELQYYF